jgi:hypothetical protein
VTQQTSSANLSPRTLSRYSVHDPCSYLTRAAEAHLQSAAQMCLGVSCTRCLYQETLLPAAELGTCRGTEAAFSSTQNGGFSVLTILWLSTLAPGD